ncbi:MAG: YIP1 family protein [Paracoccaceae bacterium]
MTPTISQLLTGALYTVRNPRNAARRVMDIRMERRDRWEVLLLISVLSAALAYISLTVAGATSANEFEDTLSISPIMLGISQLIVLLAMVFSIHLVGTWAGGTGSLDDAILLVAWMQFILICLQVLQIAAVIVLPVVALLMGLVGLVLVFVFLTIFVSELHGFKSLSGVFFSVLFVMLILATFIRFIFNIFGFDVTGVL